MKMKHVIAMVVVALAASIHSAYPVQGVRLSIQNSTDVVLRWPSRAGETFIVAYRPDLQPGTPWTFLTTGHAAAPTGMETTYTHVNIVTYPPSGGAGGGSGGPPPSPGAQSMTSSSDGSDVGRSPWDKWMYEGRAPYTWELEERPPYPWDPDAQAKRTEPQFFSADSSTQEASSQSASALPPVGSMGFYIVTEYEEDIDGDAVDNESEIYIGHNILNSDSDGDGTPDGAEDSDMDGYDDATESILGTDPLVPEDGGFPPLNNGGVFSGEFDLSFTPNPNYADILGPMLFCNNNITADSLIATEVSPGNVRLQWQSAFIHAEASAGAQSSPSASPASSFTGEEARLLHDAFGGGTSLRNNTISQPNQARIDALPRELLERYEQFAAESVRESFELIQRVNAGTYDPPGGVENFMRARVAFIHTQFTRMQAIASSLTRRFARAVNRMLPFAGGIIILANAPEIAAQFLAATRDYARDIATGDDETGSAAILSGNCNDLAPGSGNIVLNYLLR